MLSQSDAVEKVETQVGYQAHETLVAVLVSRKAGVYLGLALEFHVARY